MPFLEVMQAYFRGEKLEAALFILPAGILLVILGAVALRVERGGFAWGVAAPCILFGLVAIFTGGAVAARTDRQVAEIAREFEEAPGAMVAKELPRMEKVNADFQRYFAAFVASAAAGLLLVLLVRAGWARGLGPALLLVGAIGLLIDGFASRRAVPYTAALEDLAKEHAPGPRGAR